jgi:hypothetical protein
MTQNQKDILDMFRRVYNYVKVLTSAISITRPGLITAIDKLKTDAIDKIDEKEAKQQQILKGYTDNKAAKRHDLNVHLFHHTSGTYSWAGLTGNATLQGQMRYTNSDIINITDETIVNVTNDLIGLITPHIAVVGLNDMGVDGASMLLLQSAKTAYHNVESEPNEMIQLRSAYTQQIGTLTDSGRTFLNTVVDTAADTLKLTQKEWWDGYQHERIIINTGHRHTAIEGTLFGKDPLDATKLAGFYGGSVTATHEDGTVYTQKVDEVGHFKLLKVKNGIYPSIVFTAPGRQPFQLAARRVKKGQVLHQDVYMAPEGEVEGSHGIVN